MRTVTGPDGIPPMGGGTDAKPVTLATDPSVGWYCAGRDAEDEQPATPNSKSMPATTMGGIPFIPVGRSMPWPGFNSPPMTYAGHPSVHDCKLSCAPGPTRVTRRRAEQVEDASDRRSAASMHSYDERPSRLSGFGVHYRTVMSTCGARVLSGTPGSMWTCARAPPAWSRLIPAPTP